MSPLQIFVILCSVTAILGACPNIISREEWGARPANTDALVVFPPTHVIIHHAASANCYTQTDCAALVRSFQNLHMDENGWDDIGYNFLIGGDGNIYEGRGWGKTGAHAPTYNDHSIGICAIGNFVSSEPSTAAISKFHELIACGVDSGQISSEYLLAGHRQVSDTECPGQRFFEMVSGWSHWTSSP